MNDVLGELDRVLADRRQADAADSYVARLYAAGRTEIARKIGEEATETVIAGCTRDDKAVLHETADLWFHSLVLLAERGLSSRDVLQELARRFGTSGVEEKAARQQSSDS